MLRKPIEWQYILVADQAIRMHTQVIKIEFCDDEAILDYRGMQVDQGDGCWAARREGLDRRTTVELIRVKENVPKLTRRFPRRAFSR